LKQKGVKMTHDETKIKNRCLDFLFKNKKTESGKGGGSKAQGRRATGQESRFLFLSLHSKINY